MTLEKLNQIQGNEWLGPWQRDAAYLVGNNSEILIQGPRQAMGKTHLDALTATAFLVHGGSVIQAMPTMAQGKTILFRDTSGMVNAIKEHLPRGAMRVETDTKTEKSYSNGAKFQLVSVEQMKDEEHPPEGYRAELIIIDEAHRATEKILGICTPMLFWARKAGVAKLLLSGVGGHRLSLIEAMKKKGYTVTRATPDMIVQADPSFQKVFDKYKGELTDTEYRQHILCEQVSEGMRRMFGDIGKAIPFTQTELSQTRETLYFGIDVGRSSDKTCVAVLRKRGGYLDLIDVFYTMGEFTNASGTGQDLQVFNFIDRYTYSRNNIAIEINGLGVGLWDNLKKDLLYNIMGVPLTYDLKKMLIDQLTNDIRDGIFRCEQQVDIDELEGLQFEITVSKAEKFMYVWDHSDLMSAILMAYASQQRVLSYA